MVYWLALKVVPVRSITATALLVVGLQVMGVDVIGPAVDFGASLLDDLLRWIESQLTASWQFW